MAPVDPDGPGSKWDITGGELTLIFNETRLTIGVSPCYVLGQEFFAIAVEMNAVSDSTVDEQVIQELPSGEYMAWLSSVRFI